MARSRTSAVFGLICARTGYPAAFALTATLILAAVPVAVREQKAVASVVMGPSRGALPTAPAGR